MAAIIALPAAAPGQQGSGDTATSQRAVTLHYRDGSFEERYIPYSRNFVVVGSTRLPTGVVDLAELSVLRKDGTTITKRCWARPSDDRDARRQAEFSILVATPLRMGKKYDFKFKFYAQPSASDFPFDGMEDLVNAVTRRLQAGQLQTDKVLPTIQQQLDSASKHYLQGRVPELLNADRPPSQGSCPVLSPGPPTLEVDERFAEGVRSAVDTIQAFRRASALADSVEGEWRTAKTALLVSGESEPDSVLTLLRTGLQNNPALNYEESHLDALRNSFRGNRNPMAADTSSALLEFLNGDPTERRAVITDSITTLLRNLITQNDAFRMRHTERNRLEAKMGVLRQGLARDAPRLIREVYLPRAQTIIEDVAAWEGRAASQKLKTSVSVGFGAATAGQFRRNRPTTEVPPRVEQSWTFISATFIRYHLLGQVDKSLPFDEAYSPWLGARFSIDIGFLLTGLSFEGRDMEKAGPGFHPLFGVGVDTDTNLAFHLGAVLFKQPSTNPLSSRTKLTVGLYLAMAYDLDLFNFVKSRLPSGAASQLP